MIAQPARSPEQPVEEVISAPISRKRKFQWKKIKYLPYVIVIFLFILVSVVPSWFVTHPPNLNDLSIRLKAPGFVAENGSSFILGTDDLGRDVYSRLIYGARVSLAVSVTAVLLSGVVGGLLGILAGYYRNAVSSIIMRLADIILSIPFLLLAIITVAVLGPSLFNLIIVLGLTRWPRYARVAQGKTLATVNQDFVKAAEALGAKSRRIIFKHIIPDVVPSLVVVGSIEVGLMIIYEASLSFLGLGVQPPNASWGSMLTMGQQYVEQAWWLATLPGLAIFLVVISANMIGDLIRDKLDPKNKTR
jgi:peptide/nickel transport system permease protein